MQQSDFGHATIDVKLCTRDIAGLIGCEESDSLGNLVWVAQSSEWDVVLDLLFHLQERLALLKVFQNRSVDVTRAEHIYAMRRSRKSLVQVRAKERTAALVALYTLIAGKPLILAINPFRMMEPPSFISGRGSLHGKEQTSHVGVEVKIEKLLVHRAKRCQQRRLRASA